MFLRTETEDSTPLENERMEAPDTSCSKRDGVFALLNAGVKFEDVLQLYPQCEDIGREWVETGPPEASAGSQVLGVAAHLLEQSMSPLISESFRTNFLKALQNDPPEEFLCPIMHTLIKDPVVLSSGYVVDRSTALNDKGEMRFSQCPFTRKRLVNMVYPMESLRQQLSRWKAGRLEVIMETMMKIMDVGGRDELRACLQVASNFLDDIGREVYPRWASQEHDLYNRVISDMLAAYESDDNDGNLVVDDIVHLFLSFWKSSQLDSNRSVCFCKRAEGVIAMSTKSASSHLWLDAYGRIMHQVPHFDRKARLTLARQYLTDVKINGDAALIARAQKGVADLLLTTARRYLVEGAGSKESLGEYVCIVGDDRDGCPHFRNRHGVSLLRYRFRHTGNAYWFIAKLDPNGDDACDIDYYRTKSPTEVRMPPADVDWICKESRGNGGISPVPSIRALYDSTHDLDAFFAEEGLVGSPDAAAPLWTESTAAGWFEDQTSYHAESTDSDYETVSAYSDESGESQ